MFYKRWGDPTTEEGRQLLHDRSPLSKVEAIKKPLLIGHGVNDPRVKQAESDQIVNAMAKEGIPVHARSKFKWRPPVRNRPHHASAVNGAAYSRC